MPLIVDFAERSLREMAVKAKAVIRAFIPISPTLKRVLERRRKGPDGSDLCTDAYVFGNAVGEPISRRLANRWWAAACKAAKIDDLHFHDLRHEFGSQLLEAGGELHEVQAALGHTNIKMTSTYLNATLEGVRQAFRKLESKRRRQHLKVVRRGPHMARGAKRRGDVAADKSCICNT
jgi:integrase